jgi:DNA-binding transcriptional MerR regulator
MKINQVEELVGITKKNIRFYEEQGLSVRSETKITAIETILLRT